MTPVSSSDYVDAVEQNLGWCVQCESFTRECTEPDADGYDCPECGESVVTGAELALLTGQIELSEAREIR